MVALVVLSVARVEAQTVHFTFTAPTENSYSIVIDGLEAGCVLEPNDEVGVFDGDLCVGASVFLGTFPLPATAWEDDPQTTGVDGYQSGNPISFRIWRQASDTEGGMNAIFTYANGTFGDGIFARAAISDGQAPDITCPPDIEIDCAALTDPGNTGFATASDPCDASPTVTFSDVQAGDVITRTWTAVDISGNGSSCDQIITLVDSTAPVVSCPADLVVECGDLTDPSVTGTATALDDCDASPVINFSDVRVGDVITRTWTAADAVGNSSSCDQRLTIEDTTPPVITCPTSIVIECGDPTDPAATGEATATDVCDPSPVITYVDVQAGDVITRTWTAADAAGNSNTCDQVITIEDTTPPVISCPADLFVECGSATDPTATGEATATDVCDPSPVITYVDAQAGDVITRTWTAADAAGNSSACDQVITIEDATPPVISCPADLFVECGSTTDPTATGEATATDVCDPSPVITYVDFQVGDVITRTWTAADAAGNSNTCDQVITIEDTTPPVISCPADLFVECGSTTDPTATGEATATDVCDPSPVITYVDAQAGDVITRIWTATDAAGNSASCDQAITMEDTTPPTISCPVNVTVECGDPTDPSATGSATATDVCDESVVVAFSDITAGDVITRTWEATDAAGNTATCDQTIALDDTTPPDVTCPPDVAVACDGSTHPSLTGMATATDACDGDPQVAFSDVRSGDMIIRTWSATDISGNSASCDQNITLEDTTPPQIVCPANTAVECGNPLDPSVTGSATATDNCDAGPTITFTDSGTGDEIIRTWTAADAAGNGVSCDQVIAIEDTTPPVISCPADVFVECGGSTDPTATGLATATDICDGEPSITSSDIQSGDIITRTWTAMDASGNSASCDQTITIEDTTPPTIACPADITIDCGGSSEPSVTGSATATDVCDVSPDVTFSDSQEGFVITRSWTASDASGNSASCEQVITLVDTTEPVITCPESVITPCGSPIDPDNTGYALSSDDCDANPVLTFTDLWTGGIIDRTWIATDESGNSAHCIQRITFVIGPVPQVPDTLYSTVDTLIPAEPYTISWDPIPAALEYRLFENSTEIYVGSRTDTTLVRDDVSGLADLQYTLRACNACGCSDASRALIVAVPGQTGVEDGGASGLPTSFALSQNYPNPFNPVTRIDFALPERSGVELAVFNVLGVRVSTLIAREMAAGRYSLTWDAAENASGVYLYRLTAGNFVTTRKMLLLK